LSDDMEIFFGRHACLDVKWTNRMEQGTGGPVP